MVILTLAIVMTLGVITFLFSEKTHISSVPILIVLGMVFGPILGLIDRSIAQDLFNYIRVFGLVVILFAEGHNLKWPLLKKHMATIGILDTVGLFITAIVAAFFFSIFFHVPFLVGFLFGAIISATDPATLIPLFKQHKINENIRTVIVTESIFNDPLGIVLTVLAVALLVPQAPSAKFIESIAHYTTLYPAAVIFFVYEVGISILIGIVLGIVGYWLSRAFKLENFSEIYSLALAFGGFAIGKWLQLRNPSMVSGAPLSTASPQSEVYWLPWASRAIPSAGRIWPVGMESSRGLGRGRTRRRLPGPRAAPTRDSAKGCLDDRVSAPPEDAGRTA